MHHVWRSRGRAFSIQIGLLLCMGLGAPAFAADQVGTLATRVNAAYHAHRYAAMETDVGQLLKLLPEFPQAIYFMAIARAGQGDRAGALRALDRLADKGLYFDIRKQAVLKQLQGATRFASIEQRFAANLKPTGHAKPAFRLREKDFIPEGVAYDRRDGDFFVSSVHLREIVRVHQGHVIIFADRSSGLDSVLGIRVDTKRDALWATSAALPQMQGYAQAQQGRTALFRFDLRTGALIATYRPTDAGDHQFNDLDVAPDGTVFVADGDGGVYVLKPGARRLEPLTPANTLHSAQGLVLSADGRRLYVADYAGGLFAFDLQTRRLIRVTAPPDVCVYGIDGLLANGNDLVATQNGIQPQRIIRYRLGDGGLVVESAQVLSANDPLVPEPTLLTIVDGTLYVVANSQWSRFDANGHLSPDGSLQAPLIAKLPLH
ncbi:MAG TPA: SMP-30/gluconolactonase/LRE family protein [Rhodanobacteraceae bacterium]|nr:SMP-30/gluconolactonase/LRE family protein [Rhodanobacteraceae bacterium]